jgi:hypothetical protein
MKYQPPVGGAANDPYIDANPGIGQEGSAVPAAAIEESQRELVAVLAAQGLTPSELDLAQLLKALKMGGSQFGIITDADDHTLLDADWGKLHIYTGAGGHTFDWTNADKAGLNFMLANMGTGNLTLNPTSTQTIDGSLTVTLAPGQSVRVLRVSDTAAIVIAASGYGHTPYDIPFMAGWGSTFAGEDLAVQTYGVIIVPRVMKIMGGSGHLGTAATGAAFIIDVKRNGTSIYTTKPQFAISANSMTAGVLDAAQVDCAVGDRLDFLATQIGSTIKGQKLRFTLTGELR